MKGQPTVVLVEQSLIMVGWLFPPLYRRTWTVTVCTMDNHLYLISHVPPKLPKL